MYSGRAFVSFPFIFEFCFVVGAVVSTTETFKSYLTCMSKLDFIGI